VFGESPRVDVHLADDLTRRPRDYAVRTVHVELRPDVIFQLLEAVAQPRPNHWSRVWPTALAMSRWLLDQPSASLPREAFELGCGMGLVSVTAAHLGLVTHGTDREPLAIALALENAERNGVSGLTTSLLEWSDAITTSTPLLLASDLVYEASSPDVLYALAHTAGLLAPGGVLVMAGPTARAELANTLVRRFRDAGYAHGSQTVHVEWEGHEDQVELHTLRRPGKLGLD
jgi:predicted nicotinamide N-methyase